MSVRNTTKRGRTRPRSVIGGKETTAGTGPGVPRSEALNTEFLYYSSTIRTLAPALSKQSDRERVLPWLRKLFGPEYYAERFREKRNMYLLHLTLNLLNDELTGVFRKPPPPGALPSIKELIASHKPKPQEWERDNTWEEIRNDLFDLPLFGPLSCRIHELMDCPQLTSDGNILLDNMFRYLLYLLRPVAALFTCPINRGKVASWMQHLCRIGPDSCAYMKGIRNDYIIALYSYASDLRLAGIFQMYPTYDNLISLPRASKRYAERHPLMNPTSPEANALLQDQPVPKTGALCYIVVTEDIGAAEEETTLAELDKGMSKPKISKVRQLCVWERKK